MPGWANSTSCLQHKTSPTTWMCRSTPFTGGGTEDEDQPLFGWVSTSAIAETTSSSGYSCSFKPHNQVEAEDASMLFLHGQSATDGRTGIQAGI